MTAAAHILVVDDEKLVRWALRERLTRSQYQVSSAESGEEALERLHASAPDVMLLDVHLPGIDGLEVLRRALEFHPDLVVVMMSAHAAFDIAVEGMKRGASDFLVKPFPLSALDAAVKRAVETAAHRRLPTGHASKSEGTSGVQLLVGRSPAIEQIREMVARVAASDAATVLIEGESGTGKDVVARSIHSQSARAHKPYLFISCAAVPDHETELFGHEQGAFTDSRAQKAGLFDAAAGGTVVLDEIGDMPSGCQGKLLGLLERCPLHRAGVDSDVRVIAATNVDLAQRVADGRFRPDLYFRLNVVRIVIPPLRNHLEDLPLLVTTFLDLYNEQLKRNVRGVSARALELFTSYRWPGNVRELRNVIECALVLYGEIDQICPEHLPDSICHRRLIDPPPTHTNLMDDRGSQPESLELEAVESRLIMEAMQKAHGNQSEAARLLGLTRDTLRYRMKKHLLVEHGEPG